MNVFINYAPGDNGGAIGAAFVVANKYYNKIKNIKTPYLGSEYSDIEIKKFLKTSPSKKNFHINSMKVMMNFLILLLN